MPVLRLKHQFVERLMYLHDLSSFRYEVTVLLELWLFDPLHCSAASLSAIFDKESSVMMRLKNEKRCN
jgi:hypothetical protein